MKTGRMTRKVGAGKDRGGHRWCGPGDCLGAPDCSRCDETCGPFRHAHRPPNDRRTFVPSTLPDGCFETTRRRSA